MTSPTAYELLTAHFNEYKYKRGDYVGWAPLDPTRRRKTNQRVSTSSDQAVVVCYNTTIMRAFPDGRVQISASHWRTACTKNALNQALARAGLYAFICSTRRFGLSQWHYVTLAAPRTAYAYYDTMELNRDGTPTAPRPFQRRCIDTTLSRPFAQQAQEFREVFPILHAAVPDTQDNASAANTDTKRAYYKHKLHDSRVLAHAITTQPELWPTIVAAYSYPNHYVTWQQCKLPAKDALNLIMNQAKSHMSHIINTDITAV